MAARKPKVKPEQPEPKVPTGPNVPQVAGAFTRPPTAGEVDAIFRAKLADNQEMGLRSFIDQIRALTDMRHPVRIPREYRATTKEVRTPHTRDSWLRIAAALTKDRPVPEAGPRNHSDDAKLAADITSRWLDAEWQEIVNTNNGESLTYKSARSLVRDSESVIKVVDRANAWANFPAQDADEEADRYLNRRERAKRKEGRVQPFAAREVDRLQMVFGDGEYGDTWAIEYGLYPTPVIMNEYGLGNLSADDEYVLPQYKIDGRPVPMGYPQRTAVGGSSGMTIKLEYFDKNYWCVVINGKMAPGWPKENPYSPKLPYFRAIADPALYSLLYLQPAIDALLTGKMNWAFLSMFPVPQFEPVSSGQQSGIMPPLGDESTPPIGMKWKPGFAMMPPQGYKMSFLQPPQTGRDVDVMVNYLKDFIDIAGIPSVMRGEGGARQAGYALNQLMAAANLHYRQMAQSLSRQFERASEFMLDCIEDIYEGETVYVKGDAEETRQWLGVTATGTVKENIAPLDLVDGVEYKFKPVLPTDEQAIEMIGLQAWTAGAISHETLLREHFNMEDPQGEMDKIAVEKVLATDPVLHQQMTEHALRQAGIPPPPPPPPPLPLPTGLVGPDGMPIASGLPPPGPMPVDGRVAGGIPSVAAINRPIVPPHPAQELIHGGGRPPGAFPGSPGGPRRAA